MHIEYKEEKKRGNRRVKFSDANTRREKKNNENDKTKPTNKQAHDIIFFFLFFSFFHHQHLFLTQSNLQNITRPKRERDTHTSIHQDTPCKFRLKCEEQHRSRRIKRANQQEENKNRRKKRIPMT